jgi:ABC-type bacteriocin/lantibiotic exporter with double-glycine peptidase domain
LTYQPYENHARTIDKIARAVAPKPKILMFDEATSALDAESEKQVQRAIDAILSKCTVIMVAHRLNTLKKSDFIYRIEGGCATLCPSYESLINETSGFLP